ncbi:hypothetical protein JOF56_001877 [Kibdelosporangium banguiense]|uniref:Ribbon-helix-helix protein CopG domain-containing protein n=1 Tax=Kibdelosporangium banguiense TaxID=1365924 RepID=A0ABS4TAR0_9PSEU|nr:hypothetical protein [Kibdelosporangium banguiense]MBP2321492.1 hypothetical protein [Kibdelosporangium banguiense]
MTRTDAGRTGSAEETEAPRSEPQAKRVNVAVTPETVRALESVIEREGVSLTEAVRRLVGYGEFVYRAVKEENAHVLVKTADGVREVVLI